MEAFGAEITLPNINLQQIDKSEILHQPLLRPLS